MDLWVFLIVVVAKKKQGVV